MSGRRYTLRFTVADGTVSPWCFDGTVCFGGLFPSFTVGDSVNRPTKPWYLSVLAPHWKESPMKTLAWLAISVVMIVVCTCIDWSGSQVLAGPKPESYWQIDDL